MMEGAPPGQIGELYCTTQSNNNQTKRGTHGHVQESTLINEGVCLHLPSQ